MPADRGRRIARRHVIKCHDPAPLYPPRIKNERGSGGDDRGRGHVGDRVSTLPFGWPAWRSETARGFVRRARQQDGFRSTNILVTRQYPLKADGIGAVQRMPTAETHARRTSIPVVLRTRDATGSVKCLQSQAVPGTPTFPRLTDRACSESVPCLTGSFLQHNDAIPSPPVSENPNAGIPFYRRLPGDTLWYFASTLSKAPTGQLDRQFSNRCSSRRIPSNGRGCRRLQTAPRSGRGDRCHPCRRTLIRRNKGTQK